MNNDLERQADNPPEETDEDEGRVRDEERQRATPCTPWRMSFQNGDDLGSPLAPMLLSEAEAHTYNQLSNESEKTEPQFFIRRKLLRRRNSSRQKSMRQSRSANSPLAKKPEHRRTAMTYRAGSVQQEGKENITMFSPKKPR